MIENQLLLIKIKLFHLGQNVLHLEILETNNIKEEWFREFTMLYYSLLFFYVCQINILRHVSLFNY